MASGPNNISEMPWSPEVLAQIEQKKQALRKAGDLIIDTAAAAAGVAVPILVAASVAASSTTGACVPVAASLAASVTAVAPMSIEASKEPIKEVVHRSSDAAVDYSYRNRGRS